ncbi:metallophosphoesterase family protein [Clostridium septicum]|uniref:Phosphoesterase n=1 Tax=Clostridium septicum TaxID=1504 RepID=A0A9N7JL85_CLOSE|nr:metallophosphoesterase family protein [Clostridium septicum]AYE34458.1 phosphodiesterase [Clostridium septicum]MDU1312463.1 metallophosphoesterase family protein [Clostridium septicum]QAS59861.1 metallophosphoesterase [Clostridium septicum]UEC20899.1 metallophosphatase family protein [Clostridium septicum]USS01050.1 metallophosphatase family protein [Clostridium septicum]
MRIAAISDIHGNIYALMKTLEDIDEQKVDMIVCLGDLVGYGPHPNEVIALIRRRNLPCIKGNYDASVVDGAFSYIRDTEINSFSLPWNCQEVRESNKFYLNQLPEFLEYKVDDLKIKFVHGSPNKINEYLFADAENTQKIMEDLKEDVLVCAHTHIPIIKEFNNKLFINVGSVGKPKIGRPNITYCILDIENNTVKSRIRELEYEYKRIVKDTQLLSFPCNLINSYISGKE